MAVAARVPGGLVEVRGADRTSYLHAVLSQDIERLDVGRVAGALHLDAQGRPLAMVDVAVLEDRIALLTPTTDVADELATQLGSRTFLADASFASRPVAVIAMRGADANEVAARAGYEVTPGSVTEVGEELAFCHLRHGATTGDVDVVVDPDDAASTVERLVAAGADAGTADDIGAWRVEHGQPAWSREVRAPHLPEEAGLLPTHVHLQKGCYPGQEAVARMWMLGRPRRRLARVHLVGSAGEGWSTGSGRGQVEVTSAADAQGQRVGLAFVPPGTAPGTRFGDDEAGFIVRDLVAEDVPVPGHDASVARRRDQVTAAGPPSATGSA